MSLALRIQTTSQSFLRVIPTVHIRSRPLYTMSEVAQTNRPIVISGPSGAGKSTVLDRLFKKYPDKFGFSVSHTTRQPRGAEKDGVEYNFVTPDEFESMIKDNAFVEHANFGGNYYGTSVQAVQKVAEQGRTCILDIEMEGVKQIHRHPDFSHVARYLFLKPPSFEILEQRLRGRGTDKEEAIQKRLTQAKKELEYADTPGAHDKIVVNNDLDTAWKEVETWIFEKGSS